MHVRIPLGQLHRAPLDLIRVARLERREQSLGTRAKRVSARGASWEGRHSPSSPVPERARPAETIAHLASDREAHARLVFPPLEFVRREGVAVKDEEAKRAPARVDTAQLHTTRAARNVDLVAEAAQASQSAGELCIGVRVWQEEWGGVMGWSARAGVSLGSVGEPRERREQSAAGPARRREGRTAAVLTFELSCVELELHPLRC